jgi:hypothetical protein
MKKSVYLSSLLVICLSLFAVTAKAQVPVVTTDPTHDTTCQMDTAWFNVTATGAATLTYMWQWSSDAGFSWDTVHNGSMYSGATSDTLRVIPHVAQNGFLYRALVFNTDGSDTSAEAMLTVDTAYAGAISGMVPVCLGSTISLSSSVAGGVWSNVHHDIDTLDPLGMLEGLAFGRDTISYTVMNTCGTSVSMAYARVDTAVSAAPVTGPTHVCVANIITLANTNVIGSWTWSSATANSSVTSSGVVTGLIAGTDIITYAFSNACSSVESYKFITIETLPAAGTISGASAVCAGTWTHLTSSVGGGIWLSGAPSVAVVNTSGDVTGVTQGTSIISYYQSNSCGASFSTHSIDVEVVAASISGNDSVGIDSIIILSNSTPGGTWSSADTMIAKLITGGTVKGIDTGVTTISYMVVNTCGSSYSTIPMNVGPLPSAGVITGGDSVCVGATASLDASVGGGTWMSLHDTLATVLAFDDTTGKVTGVMYGKDTLVYTVTTAFGKRSIKKPVFVNQPPVIIISGPSSVALGGSYSLLASPVGGTWTTTNPAMAPLTATSTALDSGINKSVGFFAVIDTGTSIFRYTATNTCGTRFNTFTVNLPGSVSVNGVAIDHSASLNVYPNPSQGSLTLNVISSVSEKVSVVLTNVTGQTVKELTLMTNTATNVTINQPSGVYMLTATTADGSRYTTRIIIAD